MTTATLDVDRRIVGRERELAELSAAVAAADRVGGGVVLLAGPPGVGKSALIATFGADVQRRGCVFAYGRCRADASAPHAAIGEALAAIVTAMSAHEPPEYHRWRSDLATGIGGMATVLTGLVPSMANVVEATHDVVELDPADARNRLRRAVIRMVSDTAAYRPVVLAIDDLQWADPDTLSLMSELLRSSLRNVIVVGAHRRGEFDPAATGLAKDGMRSIAVDPLTRDDVESLLANVCGRGIELGDVAAEFHRRTGGNPLQIRQLLYQAHRHGALIPAGNGRWGWDLRILSSIAVSLTAAEFLRHHFQQLRPLHREVLCSLSCIGGEFDLDDATAAAALPADVVAQTLWECLELRLLDAVDSAGRRIANALSRDARYRFSHDRVAETARDGLTDAVERAVHLRMARRLVGRGDDRLFEAARHIGASGGEVGDEDERLRFVDVLRRAALKSRAQASFPLAFDHCRSAIDLLGPSRWKAHPVLARALQFEAADAALLVADVPALDELLDEAGPMMPEPADRARLGYLRLKGRVAQNRLHDALDEGHRVLAEFGEALPADAGKPRIGNALLRMKLTTSRWSTERLLALSMCKDPLVMELQRVLAEMRTMSYAVRPKLIPLLVRKQLELTLTHGHTPSFPLVLAGYGLVLAIVGDHGNSQRFGEAALMLCERPEFRQARPEAVFVYLSFIHHWRHPLRNGLGMLREAVTEALDQGDQEYAGFLVAALISQSFWLGRPLAEIDLLAQSLVPEIRSQPVPRTICQAMQQLCLNFMGRTEDPFLLAGESGYDEREVVHAALLEGDVVTLGIAATMKQGLYFWSGDETRAMAATDDAITHIGGLVGTAVAQLVYLIGALSMMRCAPRDRSTARFVRQSLALHRKAAAGAPENYAASYALLQGAWARTRGRNGEAERHLHRAIELAETHQLPMICARAQEEAAVLYGDTGRYSLRDHMLRLAYQRWLTAGLAVRTDWLAKEHPWLLNRDLVQTGSPGIDPINAHQLVRTLSGARTLDKLAGVIVGTVADTTGATRVLLLTGSADELTVQAVGEHGCVTMVTEDPPNVSLDWDVVGRVVVDGSAALDESRLVVPIALQGNVIGVVYAELEPCAGHFSADHREAVAFVCDQAAAPLSNFALQARLHAADEHRQSLMDVQSRFVPNELLRILDIDDLRRVRNGYRVEREMTVLISDIRGYTTMLEDMDTAEAGNLAMGFLRAVELPIIGCNGLIQDIRGDEVVAVFESETDAVRAGLAMVRSLREHNLERAALGSEELRAGIGIHTGPVGVGLVGGVNRMVLTIIGDAVNLAARIESTNKRYGSTLLISGATHDRIVENGSFDTRRMERVMVVNRRRPVTIYEVYDEDSASLRAAKRAAQPSFDAAFALFDAGDVDAARGAFEKCVELLPDDAVAPLHLAHCDAVSRGEMGPGQDVALRQK